MSNRRAIEQFLVSFFFLEVGGQLVVSIVLRLLRWAGCPQPYDWYHALPYHHHLLFTLLLIIAIVGNIVVILRRRKRYSQVATDYDIENETHESLTS